jgi:hypothetical protein
VQEQNGRLSVTRSETYRNLSMDSASPAYAVAVVNAGSDLVRLERPNGLPFGPAATAVSGVLTQPDLDRLGDNARRLAVALDGSRGGEFDFLQGGGDALAGAAFAAHMADLALRIQNGVRAIDPGNPVYANFTCIATVNGAEGALEATSGTQAGDEEGSAVVFSTATRNNAAAILYLGAANGRRETIGSAAVRPAQTGTAWIRQDPPLDFTALDSPGSIDVDLIDPAATVLFHQVIALWPNDPARPKDLAHLRAHLQTAFADSARAELAGARVTVSDGSIVVTAGGDNPALRIRFNARPTAGPINLVNGAQMNVAAYRAGAHGAKRSDARRGRHRADPARTAGFACRQDRHLRARVRIRFPPAESRTNFQIRPPSAVDGTHRKASSSMRAERGQGCPSPSWSVCAATSALKVRTAGATSRAATKPVILMPQ